jgi:hypothetical protein
MTPTETLIWQIEATALQMPICEHKFHSKRKWRFDLAWINRCIAVEVEGGVWSRGRHVRPAGFLGDLEKYNQATLAGWRVYRVTPEMIENGEALALITLALEGA